MDTVFSAFGFQILALIAFLIITFAPVINPHGRWHDIATYISYLSVLGAAFCWIMALTLTPSFRDIVGFTQQIWLAVASILALVYCFAVPPLIEWLELRRRHMTDA